jgi:hypothetical protein
MMQKREKDQPLSDAEIEKRATDAMRRALSTPYKSQSDMKLGKRKVAPKSKSPKSA